MSFKEIVNEVSSLLTKSKKTLAGETLNYLTGIMYMSPANIAAVEVCAGRGACTKVCLISSGQLGMSHGQKASLERKYEYVLNKDDFNTRLLKEINRVLKEAKNKSMIPCIRLNGTSDIDWGKEKITYKNKNGEIIDTGKNVFELYPDLQFYDYTKRADIYEKYINKQLPSNYYMVFSADTTNHDLCSYFLKKGGSVAMVFDPFVPNKYWGYPCIDGDDHDLRFIDKKLQSGPFIVGLTPKGIAKWKTIPCGSGGDTPAKPTLTIYLQNEPKERIDSPPDFKTDPEKRIKMAEERAKGAEKTKEEKIQQFKELSPEELEAKKKEDMEKALETNIANWKEQRKKREEEWKSQRMSPYKLASELGVKPVGKVLYPSHGLKKGEERTVTWNNPSTGEKEVLKFNSKGKLIERNGEPVEVKENIFYNIFDEIYYKSSM